MYICIHSVSISKEMLTEWIQMLASPFYYCVVCYAGVQQANQSVLVQKLRVTTVETLKQAKELASQGNI